MDISIFAGCYELLVVGEYPYENGSTTPFLGSFVDKLKLVEEETKIINVPTIALNYIATTRSLNQYMKRHSHQLWAFTVLAFISKAFTQYQLLNI